MNWYALQVTATLNSNIITVQDGDDVTILTDKHWIKVGNSKPYKIQSTRINSSNVPQIILTSNFTDSTRTTEAFASRDFDDLQVLTERATLLKDTAEPKINNFSTYTKSILDTTDASQFRSRLSIVPNTRTISGSTHVEVTGDFTQDEIKVSLKNTVARKGHADDQVMTNEDLSKKFYSVDEKRLWDRFLDSCTIIFDFENDYYELGGQPKTFEEVFTFSRASSRTVINKNGQIEIIPAGQPAYTYDPVTRKFVGISVDAGVTNRLLWSDDLSRPEWIKDSGCAAAKEIDSDPIMSDTDIISGVYSSGAGKGVYQRMTVNSEEMYSFSIIAKRNLCDVTRIEIGAAYLEYDWNTGTTNSSGVTRESIKDYGRDYIRLTMCIKPGQSGTVDVKIIPDTTKAGSIKVAGTDFMEYPVEVHHIRTGATQVSTSTDSLRYIDVGKMVSSSGTYYAEISHKFNHRRQNHLLNNSSGGTYPSLAYTNPGNAQLLTSYDGNLSRNYPSNRLLDDMRNYMAMSSLKSESQNNNRLSLNGSTTTSSTAPRRIFNINGLRFGDRGSFIFFKFYFSPQTFESNELSILTKPRI